MGLPTFVIHISCIIILYHFMWYHFMWDWRYLGEGKIVQITIGRVAW